ncbi:predicted nucleoside-diphosphate-sugar epimerase [Microbacterium testaceum StLB037]|uniref:Predicted nucleoside-diphosphate-sugar epimerase n=1 Tax=Microbacterium testaceum (strain StLB037) TaxID=979556 RepID=E8NFG7_MICTS|nr:NAD(P)H-binding protein [Microbacterium testaceum]BAJ75240.1 predicted nucleoside-diphosphate-sugar epimerase [Microbacterium testaceum StLB037]
MKLAVCGATGVVGSHVRRAAEARGHEVVPLTRSTGHDLTKGLPEDALAGVETIVDVSGIQTLSRKRATDYFLSVSRTLQAAGAAAGVSHLVALSIVGIDGVTSSYYGAKGEQERAVRSGVLPWTLLRAAQFHEFAAQTIERGSVGPLVLAPRARVRPIAAAEVAEALVDLAEAGPAGDAPDLVGPRDEILADMVRTLLARRGSRRPVVEIPLPGSMGEAMSSGRLRGSRDASRQGRQTYAEWVDQLPGGH